MSQQGKGIKYIIGTLNFHASVGQCYLQVTFNLNMSQQGKKFIQRYYRNINKLKLCRPLLLSGNVQSEHVAGGNGVQKIILSEHQHFKSL